MNSRFDEAVWSGVVRRLAEVEGHIPDAPAWRGSLDSDASVVGSVRLGSAFGRRTAPRARGLRLVRVVVVLVALVALVVAAILAGSRRPVDLQTGPLGPLGILRGSDGSSRAALLPDGRVLIVSGEWQFRAIGRADIWTPDGAVVALEPPLTNRANPSVTLLLDGRVLVAGGYGGPNAGAYPSNSIASAEIWDPDTSTFEPTGSMASPRVNHTATLLLDGRVLVVGGSGPGGNQVTAEVWDPATGTFDVAGSLAAGRVGHASVLLPDGDVLIVGGRDSSSGDGVGLREIWSARTEEFTDGGVYLDDPPHVSATRLLDGNVLLAGVYAFPNPDGGGFTGVDLLRPDSLGPLTGLSRPRDGHAATLLATGDVLVTGGRHAGTGEPFDSAETWEARTGAFRAAGPMPIAAAGHDAILMPDGRVLIVLDSSGPDEFVPPVIYDPSAP